MCKEGAEQAPTAGLAIDTLAATFQRGDGELKHCEGERGGPTVRSGLPSLPSPPALDGLKSRLRPVLSFQLGADAAVAPAAPPKGKQPSAPALALSSRGAISGVEAEEFERLVARLERAESGGDVWCHVGLSLATIRGDDVALELEAAVERRPHVVLVSTKALKSGGKALSEVLKAYKGAVMVLEDCPCLEAGVVDGLLWSLGVTWRWAADGSGALRSAAPPQGPKVGEMLEDLRPRRLREDPNLAALVSATEPIYREHFHSTLLEELEDTFDDAQVAFLASPATDEEPAELLGFIVYRFWGPPLKAASILRVAVPAKHRMFGYGRQLVQWFVEKARRQPRHHTNKVALSAVPSAIAFYERLHFVRDALLEGDETQALAANDSPRALHMCYKLGRAHVPPKRR